MDNEEIDSEEADGEEIDEEETDDEKIGDEVIDDKDIDDKQWLQDWLDENTDASSTAITNATRWLEISNLPSRATQDGVEFFFARECDYEV